MQINIHSVCLFIQHMGLYGTGVGGQDYIGTSEMLEVPKSCSPCNKKAVLMRLFPTGTQ